MVARPVYIVSSDYDVRKDVETRVYTVEPYELVVMVRNDDMGFVRVVDVSSDAHPRVHRVLERVAERLVAS